MKKVIMMSMMLSGCVAYPDYTAQQSVGTTKENPYMDALYRTITISPSVAPDGTKTFGAAGWNKLPKYSRPEETVKSWHAQLIATELARQKLCMNGYSYNKVNVSNGMTTYKGKCK